MGWMPYDDVEQKRLKIHDFQAPFEYKFGETEYIIRWDPSDLRCKVTHTSYYQIRKDDDSESGYSKRPVICPTEDVDLLTRFERMHPADPTTFPKQGLKLLYTHGDKTYLTRFREYPRRVNYSIYVRAHKPEHRNGCLGVQGIRWDPDFDRIEGLKDSPFRRFGRGHGVCSAVPNWLKPHME